MTQLLCMYATSNVSLLLKDFVCAKSNPPRRHCCCCHLRLPLAGLGALCSYINSSLQSLPCSDTSINTNHPTSDEVILQQEINSFGDVCTSAKSVQGVHSSSLFSRVCATVVTLFQYRHSRVDDTGSDGGDVNAFMCVLQGC